MFAYKFGFGKEGVGGNVLCIIHKKREDAYTTSYVCSYVRGKNGRVDM